MDQNIFVSFSGLALLLLLVLSQTHAERQRAFTQSTLTTQRLQLELIKKQLQPHFILNTLT
ncbi:MAG: regulator, partial [Pseudomonadota bacterium]|nr:regulator [Pseudomonadota bacterium]